MPLSYGRPSARARFLPSYHSLLYTHKAWQIATRSGRRNEKGRAADKSHVTGAPLRRDAETRFSRAMECPLVLLAFLALPLLFSSGLRTM
ncbi:unnamed protein product, partial [Ixodes persulcatus]